MGPVPRKGAILVIVRSVKDSGVSSAKARKPIDVMFGGLNRVGPRNYVLDGSRRQTNSFAAARGDKSAMRPFVKM